MVTSELHMEQTWHKQKPGNISRNCFLLEEKRLMVL